MKKKLLLITFIIGFVFVAVPVMATDVIIDNVKVSFDDSTGYPFINAEKRTMVPLRATMEAYGATVRWDSEQNTAIVTKGVTTVTCKIGEEVLYRNGTRIQNDAPAVVVDGRTYLPIRAVLEALDAKVSWDGNVQVQSPGAGSLIYDIENSSIKVSNFWNVWTEALNLESSGNYWGAIGKYRQVAYVFLEKSDANSDAMLYNHLGNCYNAVGMIDEAVACYKRESYYWEIAGLHQAAIDASRRGDLSGSTVQIFVSTDNAKYSGKRNTSPLYIHESGVMLGVTLKRSDPFYMDAFEQNIGRDVGGYIVYGFYDLEPYASVFRVAAEKGKVIQYALQVQNLYDFMSITPEDSRYIKLAKDIQATGAKTLIRFACEMNDTTSNWYTNDYNTYIQGFRYVADIFHKYAPNCAMVWSPNFYPSDTMELYYPGDAYVDYVGISAYSEYQPETDPLGNGVDRSRFAGLLDPIVSLYGHKKPIIISECGASYVHARTGADLTEYASRQIKDLFTYIPVKYPNIVAVYLFETIDAGGRQFELDGNPSYRNAYKTSVNNANYIGSTTASSGVYNFEVGNNVTIPAGMVSLHSYIKTLENDFAYVVYSINGVDIGVSYGIPYTISTDFSPYAGQTLELTCRAFDSKGMPCASKTYTIRVE